MLGQINALTNLLQLLNVLLCTLRIPFGKNALDKPVLLNAALQISFALPVILTRFVQSLNALSPIVLKFDGRLTVLKFGN